MDKYIKYDAQPGVVLYIESKGSNRECGGACIISA